VGDPAHAIAKPSPATEDCLTWTPDSLSATGEISSSNHSGVDDALINPTLRELSMKLSRWTNESRARQGRSGLFNPSKYAAPDNPYAQMRMAHEAVGDDDVISAAADLTEGLILQEVHWESPNGTSPTSSTNSARPSTSTTTCASCTGSCSPTPSQSLQPGGVGAPTCRVPTGRVLPDGSRSRSGVPTKIITLDPLKCVPVGMSIFGEDQMAWNATKDEISLLSGDAELTFDAVMTELFLGRYAPSEIEQGELTHLGVNPNALLAFNPDRVWRHTVTRSSFERFPTSGCVRCPLARLEAAAHGVRPREPGRCRELHPAGAPRVRPPAGYA